MEKAQALRILSELERRHLKKPNWLDPAFPAQNNFITSKATFKAVQCTRRAGKSYGAGIYAFKEAYETPGSSVVVIGLTRDSVKRIFYKDILKAIDLKFNLKSNFNGSDLTVTLTNGSIIYLLGVDDSPDDMNKLLGQKNKLVIIDEGAFFRQDLHKLVYEILRPSVIDYDGTIAIISTTSNLTNTLYYNITNNKVPGWELFKWSAYDNPYIKDKWHKEIELLKANNPAVVDTPFFKRMYLNEWYIDEKGLIYKFNKDINKVVSLPNKDIKQWKYVLGIDLGYTDATAFAVCAYNEYDPQLYVVDAYSKSELIVSDVAEEIKNLNKKYKFQTMVIDGASKQVVEELKRRHQLPLIIAEKQDKRGYIEMLNSDLILGNIVLTDKANDLLTEWSTLVWDERALEKGQYKEHPNCPNHISDAFLYAWRWCFNYSSKPKVIPIRRGSEEEVDKFWEQESEQLQNKVSYLFGE